MKYKDDKDIFCLHVKTTLIEQKIKQSNGEYPFFISTRHDVVFDNNNFFERIINAVN